jgi:pilus assembly protein CpaE
MQAIRHRIGALRRSEDGVSAVEFALFAPILFYALLATVDIGLALYQRMTIDHALRAGAQTAMADPGQDAVLKAVKSTATKNFTLASTTTTSEEEPLSVSVSRSCACPENPATAVACLTICAGSAPTSITYRLTGTKAYDSLIIPSMSLSRSIQVQVR